MIVRKRIQKLNQQFQEMMLRVLIILRINFTIIFTSSKIFDFKPNKNNLFFLSPKTENTPHKRNRNVEDEEDEDMQLSVMTQ